MTGRALSPVATASLTVRMAIRGNVIERHTTEDVVDIVASRLQSPTGGGLAVGSVNLDHIHHFVNDDVFRHQPALDWLLLADGMPLAWRGQLLTAAPWPRVAGADLLPRLLIHAEDHGYRVGFLGGTAQTHERLTRQLARRYPDVIVSGMWSPDREQLETHSDEIAASIRAANTDILVVCLGKPRQEQWVAQHGSATSAKVFLPFGGAADFLAGTTRRAPRWMQLSGLEWLYRLSREPRRLARRYLVEGPASLMHLVRAEVGASSSSPVLYNPAVVTHSQTA